MGVVRFYHLTRSAVPEVAARLLSRAHAAGLRTEVRGTDRARLATLDQALWLGDGGAFLPHGLDGGDHDARQPILLTCRDAAAPETAVLMAVDAAPVDAQEAARLDRTFILFDGGEPAALEHARAQWTELVAAGAEAEYWSEASGKWERKR